MIQPIVNKPGFFLVPSADGKRMHEVHASGSCDCPDYIWRRASTYDLCRHGKALKAHLDALKACPACGGRGMFVPRIVYIGRDGRPDTSPLPCCRCNGTGRRAQADPRLAAMWDRENADARERSLKELFR